MHQLTSTEKRIRFSHKSEGFLTSRSVCRQCSCGVLQVYNAACSARHFVLQPHNPSLAIMLQLSLLWCIMQKHNIILMYLVKGNL